MNKIQRLVNSVELLERQIDYYIIAGVLNAPLYKERQAKVNAAIAELKAEKAQAKVHGVVLSELATKLTKIDRNYQDMHAELSDKNEE